MYQEFLRGKNQMKYPKEIMLKQYQGRKKTDFRCCFSFSETHTSINSQKIRVGADSRAENAVIKFQCGILTSLKKKIVIPFEV